MVRGAVNAASKGKVYVNVMSTATAQKITIARLGFIFPWPHLRFF